MGCKLNEELPIIEGLLAGVDEAGRGPLAGNVVASAVILNPQRAIHGLADSKKLTEKRRELLELEIKQHALAWSVISISAADIDSLNILQATMLAMKLAVEKLDTPPDHVFIDGNRCPEISTPATWVIKGDARVAEISAASILAKVERDRQMRALHIEYPCYGFDKHKGYPTKLHVEALQEYGPCPQHRRSYKPVKKCL